MAAGFNYGDQVKVTIREGNELRYEECILFEKSFGFAEKGDVMIYNNELMKVSMAMNQGSLIESKALSYGSDWTVEFSR